MLNSFFIISFPFFFWFFGGFNIFNKSKFSQTGSIGDSKHTGRPKTSPSNVNMEAKCRNVNMKAKEQQTNESKQWRALALSVIPYPVHFAIQWKNDGLKNKTAFIHLIQILC